MVHTHSSAQCCADAGRQAWGRLRMCRQAPAVSRFVSRGGRRCTTSAVAASCPAAEKCCADEGRAARSASTMTTAGSGAAAARAAATSCAPWASTPRSTAGASSTGPRAALTVLGQWARALRHRTRLRAQGSYALEAMQLSMDERCSLRSGAATVRTMLHTIAWLDCWPPRRRAGACACC